MTSISFSGLGSGLDINGIVGKLMQVEAQPLTALQRTEASYQAKLSAFGSLKSALSSLQSAVQTLKKPETFSGMTASSSSQDVLTAMASQSASVASYTVNVIQLAKYHAVRSSDPYTSASDTFTTGTLSIQVGSSDPVTVTIDSTNNTLAGIRDAINAADARVSASIVNDGTNYRLLLTSETLGSNGAITVSVTDSGSGGNFALGNLASPNLVTTQNADDAQININGLALARSTNTIDDAIDSVTLNLASTGTTTLTVAKNTSAVTGAINAFVKAYNDAIAGIKQMTNYDAANKKAAVLTGDSTARSIQSQLANLVFANVSGLAGDISRLSDIGITVQKDGTLALDSGKLSAALADPDKDVAALFTRTEAGNEGIAVRFYSMLEGILGASGLIASRTDGINDSIKDLQKRADALNLRLAQIEQRYRAQFSALDTMIASMLKTSSFLERQLAALPPSR